MVDVSLIVMSLVAINLVVVKLIAMRLKVVEEKNYQKTFKSKKSIKFLDFFTLLARLAFIELK